MNKFTDYYKVLQVHYEADSKMIESAYKCLCKQYHPDINTAADAADRMKELNEAYAVLSDPDARREYHKEWYRITSKPGSAMMSEEDYRRELATSVLDSFFRDMVTENWDAAYSKLTEVDHRNVPVSDFREWKVAVAKLHKLADYKIKYEKSFKNCDYGGLIFSEILMFTVEMTVLEIASGQISHEKSKKYMAHVDDSWKLCLGYADLKPVIAKFNYFSLLKAQNMQTERLHMLNYYELLDQSKRELARSRRYGNKMTLIMLTLKCKPSDMVVSEESYLEKCMSYVSKVICQTIRQTDIVGRYHEASFAIILTETPIEAGRDVMAKLIQAARRPKNLNYSLTAACTDCKSDAPMEDILKAVLRKAAPDQIKNELSYFL